MAGRLGIEGLRVLVTASTRGLGRGVAEVLLEEGAVVTVNGRSGESVERAVGELAGKGRVYGVAGDLCDLRQAGEIVDRASEYMGGLDALVYIPPPPPAGGFGEVGEDSWVKWSRCLCLSPVWAARRALRHIGGGRGGGMVFVTSIAVKEPIPDIVLSNTLRISIHGLVKSLARELGPRGIRVNAVLPGYFLTDRLKALAEKRAGERGVPVERVLDEMASSVPLRRIGEPRELGWVVAFLLSPLASYVNGASIPVDGGRLYSVL
ncbi:MAG: short-chain dehydrogenase [Hyperthermus sp.]|nr:MAG: short-chain dehydrogenase [Hyperthermus sp.]